MVRTFRSRRSYFGWTKKLKLQQERAVIRSRNSLAGYFFYPLVSIIGHWLRICGGGGAYGVGTHPGIHYPDCRPRIAVAESVPGCREPGAGRVNPKLVHQVLAEAGMRRNDIMNQVNQLIVYVSMTMPFRSGLDRHLIRAAMVSTFFAFSIQKWSQYTAEMLVPLINHSPVVFWLLPASACVAQATSSERPKRSSALSFSLAIGARGLASWARLGRS
jgi:hypothetical protein